MRTPSKNPSKKLIKYHRKLLKYQEKVAPFVPTFLEIMDLWELATTSAVSFQLRQMTKFGLAITRKRGTRTVYYAIEHPQPDGHSV